MTITATPGDAAADSYVTVAEADAYFAASDNAAWAAAVTAAKEVALRKATSYLDNQYRDRWKGYRTNKTQSLAWPRIGELTGNSRIYRNDEIMGFIYGLIDSDGFQIGTSEIPAQIKRATFEAALLALAGTTLEPVLERGGAIKSLTETVGPVTTSTTWENGASTRDRYTAIEGALRGLVKSIPGASSGNVSLVRS